MFRIGRGSLRLPWPTLSRALSTSVDSESAVLAGTVSRCLADEDRIFQNLYGEYDWRLNDSLKKQSWELCGKPNNGFSRLGQKWKTEIKKKRGGGIVLKNGRSFGGEILSNRMVLDSSSGKTK